MIAAVELRILDDFDKCRLYTRSHARSFYFASYALPKAKRMASYALYAFCRYADDAVDSATAQADAKHSLDRLSELQVLLDRLYDPRATDTSLVYAFRQTIVNYEIPKAYFLDLLRGVAFDRTKARFDTFQDLADYCYCVASVVGLMMTRIFGVSDPEALDCASDLGTAMQLTNILRDIREDFAMGRIYIPQEDLRSFGCTENDLREARLTPAFRNLMAFQVARARQYYDSARRGIPMLPDDGSRFCATLMSDIYSTILDRIEERNYDVFSTRVHVSFARKLRIALLAAFRPPATIEDALCRDSQPPVTNDARSRLVGAVSAG